MVPQNLIELWAVCTRPVTSNGFGLMPLHADRIVSRLENLFPFLRDPIEVFDEWRQLVVTYQVSGKKVYDTRLVAAVNVHGLKHILTFNTQDFVRDSNITVVNPVDIVKGF